MVGGSKGGKTGPYKKKATPHATKQKNNYIFSHPVEEPTGHNNGETNSRAWIKDRGQR